MTPTETGEHYDMIFDLVGKSTYQICRGALRKGGVYASTEFGAFPYNPVWALMTRLSKKRRVIFPIPKNRQEDLLHLNELIADGQFSPLLDRAYSLDEIVEATHYVESGQKL